MECLPDAFLSFCTSRRRRRRAEDEEEVVDCQKESDEEGSRGKEREREWSGLRTKMKEEREEREYTSLQTINIWPVSSSF